MVIVELNESLINITKSKSKHSVTMRNGMTLMEKLIILITSKTMTITLIMTMTPIQLVTPTDRVLRKKLVAPMDRVSRNEANVIQNLRQVPQTQSGCIF